MTFITLLACLVSCPANGAEEQKPLPTTIFVVRHAEKDAEQQLSPEGKERAKALAAFMSVQNVAAVYSTNFARTRDTGQPTAEVAKIALQTYEPMPKRDWYSDIARKHSGKSVLIVGHSNTVVPIVNGFGAKLKYEVGHDEYHNLFIVRVQGGMAQAVRINYGKVRQANKAAAESKKVVKP